MVPHALNQQADNQVEGKLMHEGEAQCLQKDERVFNPEAKIGENLDERILQLLPGDANHAR